MAGRLPGDLGGEPLEVIADDLGVGLVVGLADGEDAAVGDERLVLARAPALADPGDPAGCMYVSIVVGSMSL